MNFGGYQMPQRESENRMRIEVKLRLQEKSSHEVLSLKQYFCCSSAKSEETLRLFLQMLDQC
jgi:hypothetical protein